MIRHVPARRLRGPHVLPIAMFFGSFAWSFVYVSLPFHVQAISPWDATTTLRWTGWILGISPLVTVLTAPVWGRFADRGDPRTMYEITQYLQGVSFLGLAAARTLPELFLARLVLGLMGAASTFAFVSAGRAADAGEVRRQVGLVQSAMTVGQVIGPLAGAIAAARLGFRPSFVLGGAVIVACGVLVRFGVPPSDGAVAVDAAPRSARWTEVLAVSLIVLAGSTQIFFLTSVLPEILSGLGVAAGRQLEVGGVLIFVSGAAAALGSVAAPRLGDLVPERRLLRVLLAVSSVAALAFVTAGTVWLYGIVRFLQVLFIAPVFPIVVARLAQSAGGTAIGIVNAARVGAAFVGPVLATTLLASTSPTVLYVALALIGVACLPLIAPPPRTAARGVVGRAEPAR